MTITPVVSKSGLLMAAAVMASVLSGCVVTTYPKPPQIAQWAQTDKIVMEREAKEKAFTENEIKSRVEKSKVLEGVGAEAERRGKFSQAFEKYLSALRALGDGAPDDADSHIREKIFQTASRLKSPPGIPEDVERHMVLGKAAIRVGQDEAALEKAIDHFKKALRQAPWIKNAYFNLGLIQEKARQYQAAARNLHIYLLASPRSPDAKKVRARIYELEDRINTRPAEAIRGYWEGGGVWHKYRSTSKDKVVRYLVKSEGKKISIARLEEIKGEEKEKDVVFKGSFNGNKIAGLFDFKTAYPCGGYWICHLKGDFPLTGEVKEDGKVLVLTYELPVLRYFGTLFGKRDHQTEVGRYSRRLVLTRPDR